MSFFGSILFGVFLMGLMGVESKGASGKSGETLKVVENGGNRASPRVVSKEKKVEEKKEEPAEEKKSSTFDPFEQITDSQDKKEE